MDPLSITLAVITLSQATISVYKVIKKIVDTITNAPKEIESIRNDTKIVYTTLSNLQEALEETRIRRVVDTDRLAQKHVNDLVGPLRSCNETLECIVDKLREHLRPLGNGKDFKPRYQWWKARNDFQSLLARLQSDKEALSFSMMGLNTFQTLRTLGESTGNNIQGNTLVNSSKNSTTDPAKTLRSYAESIINEREFGRSCSEPQLVGMAASLTLEEKRDIVQKKRQRQDDLLTAARNGDDFEVEVLLSEGVEVDWVGRTEGKTALHLAAQYGHKMVAKQLLDHGADIEIHCGQSRTDNMIHHLAGRTPLLWAAAGDDSGGRQESLVKFLLDRGADATARSDSFRTALQEAVRYTRLSNVRPNPTVIQLLLDHGAHVNAHDTSGWTPLHEAAFYDKHELALMLLRNGAQADGKATASDPANSSNPKLADGLDSRTPLLLTASRWSIPTIRSLLNWGADVNARTADFDGASGETLLHLAASNNQPTVVAILLNAKADINIKDYVSENTALHKAAFKGHLDVIRTLLEKGADVNLRNKMGQTIVEHARSNGREAIAEFLEVVIKRSHSLRTPSRSARDRQRQS
ncbi:MAG: hypothetical protein Q9195_001141 [Heterodermia aff. obscurata]